MLNYDRECNNESFFFQREVLGVNKTGYFDPTFWFCCFDFTILTLLHWYQQHFDPSAFYLTPITKVKSMIAVFIDF